jgi:outer membrane lipoprotein SlyB
MGLAVEYAARNIVTLRRSELKEERELLIIVILAVGLLTFSCTSTGYNTQKGAAIGAGVGAIAGQLIGNNTAGTLIGAGAGALAGALVGNAVDQNETQARLENAERRTASAAPVSDQEQPPGQWVQVQGQWIGGKWIPAHRAWVPVNPTQ